MKKKIIAVALIIVAMFAFAGCDDTQTSDEKAQAQQEAMLQQQQDQLGMPNITNFQEKKLMKNIMEQCDKSDLICYVYTYSDYTGKFTYIGRCMGFGLPYGTEYTSPAKYEYHSGGSITLPQADPNGLFKDSGVQATWLNMIDEATGETFIMYAEPNMVVSAHKMPTFVLNFVPDGY